MNARKYATVFFLARLIPPRCFPTLELFVLSCITTICTATHNNNMLPNILPSMLPNMLHKFNTCFISHAYTICHSNVKPVTLILPPTSCICCAMLTIDRRHSIPYRPVVKISLSYRLHSASPIWNQG